MSERIHRDDRRHRYLLAMGIDVWVARDHVNDPASAEPSSAELSSGDLSSGDLSSKEVPRVEASLAKDSAAGDPEITTAPAQVPVAATLEHARALLEADDTHGVRTRAPTESTPPPREDASGTTVAAEAAVATVESQDAPPDANDPAPSPIPRFRLTALRCAQGLLLVDEAQLTETDRSTLARLTDLLRAGHACRGTDPSARVERQAFFWPQLDAPHVDESLPRAAEALTAWVRRCTEDGAGFLVVVRCAPTSGARACLDALDALPIHRAVVDAAFLSAPTAQTHRAAWGALAALSGAAPS